MHLAGAGLAQHAHERTLGVAAHDGVIDDDQPLIGDHLAQGIQFEPDAELANRLGGLDEGASDVGVLHEALGEGDARLLRIADRAVTARLRHGDDQVGVGGVLARETLADVDARGLHAAVRDRRVGSREVDELEEAALGLGLREAMCAQAVLVDGDELARLDLADVRRSDDVECGGLAGDHPPALESAEDERADSLGIAGGVEGRVVHEDE